MVNPALRRTRADAGFSTKVKACSAFSPSERAYVQRRFTHVLVDEFQDLNAAQLALVGDHVERLPTGDAKLKDLPMVDQGE